MKGLDLQCIRSARSDMVASQQTALNSLTSVDSDGAPGDIGKRIDRVGVVLVGLGRSCRERSGKSDSRSAGTTGIARDLVQR